MAINKYRGSVAVGGQLQCETLLINDVQVPKHNYAATAAPDADDDTSEGYSVGSIWCDVTNDEAYICLDATAANAVWTQITNA